MDEKEKLVSLLEEGHYAFYENFDPSISYMEALANHLLANGVVVSAPLNTTTQAADLVLK